jgi:hypothetical protein
MRTSENSYSTHLGAQGLVTHSTTKYDGWQTVYEGLKPGRYVQTEPG